MKNFEKITNELYGAKKAGYTFDENAKREMNEHLIRKLTAERGQRFVDQKLDAFCDLDGDLYRNADGEIDNYYAVEFVDGEPFCWQKLRKKEEDVCVRKCSECELSLEKCREIGGIQ